MRWPAAAGGVGPQVDHEGIPARIVASRLERGSRPMRGHAEALVDARLQRLDQDAQMRVRLRLDGPLQIPRAYAIASRHD